MREFLEGPLPKLIAGPFHTTSSAIHDLLYKVPLPKWTAFSEDVERFYFHQVRIYGAIYYIGRTAEGN